MQLEFLPLRFGFVAQDPVFFPPGKAGNVLRGALGIVFRSIACAPECQEARTCPNRQTCAYARVFAPVSDGEGPSGLADPPRPFVLRARHLDGRTLQPGEPFHFALHLFSLEPEVLSFFIRTFAAFAHHGLGPTRGRVVLQHVRRIGVGDFAEQDVTETSIAPVSLSLGLPVASPARIRVHFLSPMELKQENRIASRPEFGILFARIRDRIATLRTLYGPGPLDIDFQGSGARAAGIRMTHCQVHRVQAERRSSRTGQTHSIGGFTGSAEYEGELAEFLPYLAAGYWTGVGRQSVWGKGEFTVEDLAS